MYIELTTDRLLLRPLNLHDLEAVYEYSGDSGHIRYMMYLPDESIEQAREFLENAEAEWEKEAPQFYEFGIVLKEKLIGAVSLYLSEDGKEGELGWVLHRNYIKQGYATEAAAALKEFAVTGLKLGKLVAHCDKRNTASAQVMEKIGLVLEQEGIREYRNGEKAADLAYGIEVAKR